MSQTKSPPSYSQLRGDGRELLANSYELVVKYRQVVSGEDQKIYKVTCLTARWQDHTHDEISRGLRVARQMTPGLAEEQHNDCNYQYLTLVHVPSSLFKILFWEFQYAMLKRSHKSVSYTLLVAKRL